MTIRCLLMKQLFIHYLNIRFGCYVSKLSELIVSSTALGDTDTGPATSDLMSMLMKPERDVLGDSG